MIETLKCLNQKSIELLIEHKLLEKLVSAEIIKSELSQISVDQDLVNTEVLNWLQNQ